MVDALGPGPARVRPGRWQLSTATVRRLAVGLRPHHALAVATREHAIRSEADLLVIWLESCSQMFAIGQKIRQGQF